MPNLTTLSLRGFLPTRRMQCPNVTLLTITLHSGVDKVFEQDMNNLRNLLSFLPKLETIYLAFHSSILQESHSVISPITLSHLTTLRLYPTWQTDARSIGLLMDILDAPSLKHLYVELTRVSRPTWTSLLEDWMKALFTTSSQQTRVFPTVEHLSFIINESKTSLDFDAKSMFSAVPNANKLTLSLPGGCSLDADLSQAIKDGALRDLRAIYIANNVTPTYQQVLQCLRDRGGWTMQNPSERFEFKGYCSIERTSE